MFSKNSTKHYSEASWWIRWQVHKKIKNIWWTVRKYKQKWIKNKQPETKKWRIAKIASWFSVWKTNDWVKRKWEKIISCKIIQCQYRSVKRKAPEKWIFEK